MKKEARPINNNRANNGAREAYFVFLALKRIGISRCGKAADQKLVDSICINLLVKGVAIRQHALRIKLPYHIRTRWQTRLVRSQVANITFVRFTLKNHKQNQLILLDQIGRSFHGSIRIVFNGYICNNTS